MTGTKTSNPAGSPILRRVEADAHPPEFDRFKALGEKLIQVPKAELDEKLKES